MEKYIINFNSVDPFFSKEESGIKNNTIRSLEKEDQRLKILNRYINGECELVLRITNPITNKSFKRNVKDVSIFKSLYIITWKEEVKNECTTNKK